jgi:ankyrin repeat protein
MKILIILIYSVLLLALSSCAVDKQIQFSTPLHKAAFNGDDKTVNLLISKGADVNIKNNEGQTSLKFVRTEELK